MSPSNQPANVLMIVADQWRGDFIPTGHGGTLDLPNLAALCREGTRFTRHFANATPCGPARMSLLTGQYAMNHRVVQNGIGLDSGRTNLGAELRAHGRLAGLVGYTSWLPDPRITSPMDPRYAMYGAIMPGWTPVRSFEEPEFEAYFGYLQSVGYDLPADPFDIWSGTYGDGIVRPSPIDRAHSDTAWLTDGALEHIKGRGGEPWVLQLAYWRPHPPFSASAPYHRFIAPGDVEAPVRAASADEEAGTHPYLRHAIGSVGAGEYVQGFAGPASAIDVDTVRAIRAVYCGLIKEIDDQIGRVIDHLKATGQWDRTLIVFTSDHGELLGDHYLFGKQSYFDAAFHTPLIVRDPNPRADPMRGKAVDAFTEHVDLMPTILDWLGQPIPRQCDGVSVLDLLAGPAADWRDCAFMEFDFRDLKQQSHTALGLAPDQCGAAIMRGERFKYVHFAGLEPLLFDLSEDPCETTNLAAEPEHQPILSKLRSRMLDWRLIHADRTLTGISASPRGLVGSLNREPNPSSDQS